MGDGVPDHVEKEFRSYLNCGILAHGLARARGTCTPRAGTFCTRSDRSWGTTRNGAGILSGLNETFWHQGTQVEDYVSRKAGVDLSKVFDQYLRTTTVPTLEYRIEGNTIPYRWANVVPGFDMQMGATLTDAGYAEIHPTEDW